MINFKASIQRGGPITNALRGTRFSAPGGNLDDSPRGIGDFGVPCPALVPRVGRIALLRDAGSSATGLVSRWSWLR